jgi:hypothetical protein
MNGRCVPFTVTRRNRRNQRLAASQRVPPTAVGYCPPGSAYPIRDSRSSDWNTHGL